MSNAAPAVHTFLSILPHRPRKNALLELSRTRDETACREIAAALLERGFRPGQTLLNYPEPGRKEPGGTPPRLHPVDLTDVRAGDVVVYATRPAPEDHWEGGRKRIQPSYTDLEHHLDQAWDAWLPRVSRSRVRLADGVGEALPAGYRDRRAMQFYMFEPWYQALNDLNGRGWRDVPRQDRRTAAFLLRVDELWPGGPGLVSAFGMDATTTLVWAYRLRTDQAGLLDEPGFTLAELHAPEVPPRPTSLRFALEWKLEVLVQQRP